MGRQKTITQDDNEFVLANGKINSKAQHHLSKVTNHRLRCLRKVFPTGI